MSRFVRSERRKLADLFSTVGPEAPTMCTGWVTRDLAAHLVIRERRPGAGLGLFIPPLRSHAPHTPPPPLWRPVSTPRVEGMTNGLEFFVHHEDVRRAQAGWQPRDLPKEDQAALWKSASLIARLRLRKFPAALLVQAPG